MTEEENDEELEEFIKKFKKDVVRLKDVAPLMNREDIREKLGIFYNAFYSYQLAKSTKYLAYATVVLAGATVLQTINAIYGPEIAHNTIIGVTRIGIVIVMIGIGLRVLFDIIGKIINWIKRKFKR